MRKAALLGASLALNVVLLGVLAWKAKTPPEGRLSTAAPQVITNLVTRKIAGRSVLLSAPAVPRRDWRSIESEDYRTYIRNLRAFGCPEETIRDIIIADVTKLYAARWKAAHSPDRDWKFWETEDKHAKKDRERKIERHALEKEMRNLIGELLGVDLEKEMRKYALDLEADKQERAWAFLPSEKQSQVKELQDKFKEAMTALSEEAERGGNSETKKKLAELKGQYRAELSQILTPAELEEFELRSSPTANKLRKELAGFEPTEQEFRALVKVRQAFEEQMAALPETLDERNRDYLNRQFKLEYLAQARQWLGDQRHEEFLRSRSEEFQDALRLSEKLDLPKETAVRVYDINVALREEAEKVSKDPSLTDEQRDVLLRNMKLETKETLNKLIGEKNLRRLE